MKRYIVSVVLLLLAVLNGQAQQAKATEVKQLKLKNGLTVWLNEDHTQPKVYGALVVKAGAKDCPNTGIAHYLEHVLFKGTQRIGTIDYGQERVWLDSISAKYNELSQTSDAGARLQIQQDISRLSQRAAEYAIPNEFSRLISRYGGSALNASTSYDVTEYHNVFSPQYLEQWCWLNSERMLNPVFRLFQGELETVYEEKNRAADDMMTGALEHMLEKVFEGHPYQYHIIGSTENLKNPRLSDMEAFFRKYYVAGNMGLVLCGDLTAEGLEPLLERTFGRLPQGEVARQELPALKPFGGETFRLKLDIPLVKIVGLLFRGPADRDDDSYALELATGLLSNDNETGMLDSLRTAHKLMEAQGGRFAFNEAGLVGLLAIPKIPFGSKKKVERLCWEQIERVKQGDFSSQRLEELKRSLLRSEADKLETLEGRAQLLVGLFSQGRTWDDYRAQVGRIANISKADVVAVAQRYLKNDEYLRGVKKFGSYPKERVSQPNYKPVVPPHAKEQSQYARELEQLPVAARAPRLIDFDRDVETTATPNFTLYRADNPVNDLFTLSLKWHKGERNEPLQQLLDGYIGELGTDSLTKHQLGEAWQRMGTTFGVQSSSNFFMLTLHGLASQLEPSLRLLGHVLTHLKADEKAAKELKSEWGLSHRQLGRENQDVLSMVMMKLLVGDQSEYLRMPTVKEVNRLTGDEILGLFDELRRYPCDVLYSGLRSSADVASLCRRYLPLAAPQHATPDNSQRAQEHQEPMVVFYDMPSSRQTYVGAVGSLKGNLSDQEVAQLKLWSQYMGGGMSSVLFQEIREFRSMAYSTGGQDLTPNRVRHPDYPSCYIAYLGTQADKTLQALSVLDSLMEQMPLNELNVEAAKQEIVNDVNNGYPSFRQLPNFVSNYRMLGYQADPNTTVARLVPTLSASDMIDFYQKNIQKQPRVYFVIGPKKQANLQRLAQFGKVVEWKKKDVLR